MAKYHFDKETGRTGKCSAQPGNCPKGVADEAHGGTPGEARAAFEAHVEREEGLSAAGGALKKDSAEKAAARARGDAAPVESAALLNASSAYLETRNANAVTSYDQKRLLKALGETTELLPMTPGAATSMVHHAESIELAARRGLALKALTAEGTGNSPQEEAQERKQYEDVASTAASVARTLREGGAGAGEYQEAHTSYGAATLEREGAYEASKIADVLSGARRRKEVGYREAVAFMRDSLKEVEARGLQDPRSRGFREEMKAQLDLARHQQQAAVAHRKWLADHTVAQVKTKSYAVRMTEEDGRLEGRVQSLGASRYTPEIYLRETTLGGQEREPRVQTASYGALDPAEVRKVAAELRHGADVAETLDAAYNGTPQERGSKPAYDPEKLNALPKQAERPSQRTKRPERSAVKNENKLVYFKKVTGEREDTPSHVVVREMTIGDRQVQFRAIENPITGRLAPDVSISQDRSLSQPEIYLRHNFYGDEDAPVEAQVQTTSYGALSGPEVRRVADQLEKSALIAREAQRQYEKFLEDIKTVKRPSA